MHKTPKHNGVGWGGREKAVKLGSQPGQLHSPVFGSGVCPATQASSSGSRLTRPAMNKDLVCPKPMIFYVLLKCINARLVFYLAEEKSKMRNRGKRGGRRVGCIACGRLTVPSYRCSCAVLLDQTFAWVNWHVSAHGSSFCCSLLRLKHIVAPTRGVATIHLVRHLVNC